MRIKICGVTKPDQGRAIVELGATALGFICARQSPRYVTPEQIGMIVQASPSHSVWGQPLDRVGVFVDASLEEICRVVAIGGLNAVQLHGCEPPEFCQALRQVLPEVEMIKAFRVRDAAALSEASTYQNWVDTLLLDAYHPKLMGGTGTTLDWSMLQQWRSRCPWLLAGGLTPDNVLEALKLLQPDGIDLSSGVELAPGDKDLAKVERLFKQLMSL